MAEHSDLFPKEDSERKAAEQPLPKTSLFKNKAIRVIVFGVLVFAVLFLVVNRNQKPKLTPAQKQQQAVMQGIQPVDPNAVQQWASRQVQQAQQLQAQQKEAEQAKLNADAAAQEMARERQMQEQYRNSGIYQNQLVPGQAPNYPQGYGQPVSQEDRKTKERASLAAALFISPITQQNAGAISEANHVGIPIADQPEIKTEPSTRIPVPRNGISGDSAVKAGTILTQNQSAGNRYILPEGQTIIDATLVNRLNGALPSTVLCTTSTDVWSIDGQHLLIPAGSTWVGEAKPVSASGQKRLAVSFHRLRMPDLYSVDLDQLPGLDQQGVTGLTGKVNSHYFQIFGASLAIGAVGGLAQIGGGGYGGLQGYDANTQFRNGITQSMANSSQQILQHFLNKLPEVTVKEGTRVRIILAGDLALPDYQKHQMRQEVGE